MADSLRADLAKSVALMRVPDEERRGREVSSGRSAGGGRMCVSGEEGGMSGLGGGGGGGEGGVKR